MGTFVLRGAQMIGIGDPGSGFVVYIGNRPPLGEYIERQGLIPAVEEELAVIGREAGNHWRKIINIYAKLGYMIDAKGFSTWQAYREEYLLIKGSGQALLFDDRIEPLGSEEVRLICGKAHAASLFANSDLGSAVERSLQWIDGDFAVDPSQRVIVTPYFDYRQLSNAKLDTLVSIINNL